MFGWLHPLSTKNDILKGCPQAEGPSAALPGAWGLGKRHCKSQWGANQVISLGMERQEGGKVVLIVLQVTDLKFCHISWERGEASLSRERLKLTSQ